MAFRNREPLPPSGGLALERRQFLQLGTAATVLSVGCSRSAQAEGAAGAPALRPEAVVRSGARRREVLPAVPSLEDLASDRLVHHFSDLFNPPAARNEWGCVQATKSVSGIMAISIPPFACGGVPRMPFSPGNLVTCELYLDGRILNSYTEAATVAYTWYPHRIVREARTGGLRITTHTFISS